MAKTEKKPKFPSKPCPKCGKFIHARTHKHDECGWVMEANGQAAPVATKQRRKKRKLGRPAGVPAASTAGSISIEDITAVKAVVDKLGAEKVRQLAEVLAK